MAYYMLQIAYTPESLASQVRNPQNVVERTTPLIESLGGRLLSTYFSFGEFDLVQIIEMPDNASAASLAVVAAAGGALRASNTTVLMTVDEGLAAFRKAATVKYKPPL